VSYSLEYGIQYGYGVHNYTTTAPLTGMHPSHSVDACGWYATEVPAIVSGLEASSSISARTAATAWELIADGSYDRALSVVLSEAT
jgi:hypothetical protein